MFLRRKYDVLVKGLEISEEMQRNFSGIAYQYRIITTRDKARELHANQKVLRIINDDGRLKCKKCGIVPEILHMINEAYCPACFEEHYKK
jgi:hypothetical protein